MAPQTQGLLDEALQLPENDRLKIAAELLASVSGPLAKTAPDRTSRRALMEAMRASGSAKATAGPDAARSQDFLYGSEGLP